MGPTPLRAGAVERALSSGAGPGDAAAHAAAESAAPEDINASRGYREHLSRVLVARALEEARSRA
jgi:carbon-monoxide dehydrogenase medium subunit